MQAYTHSLFPCCIINYKILSTCFENKQNGGNLSLNFTLRMKLSNITSAFHEILFHSNLFILPLHWYSFGWWLLLKLNIFCISSYFCFCFLTHIEPFLIYISVKLLCKQWESEIQNKFSIWLKFAPLIQEQLV